MIEAAVEKALDRRAVRPDRKLELEGFHPLPVIMGTLYEWLLVPFRGTEVLVEVRYPRHTQLPEVDKLRHVVERNGEGKGLSRQEMIDVMNVQEACCRAVLNRPTFGEIESAVHGKDRVIERNRWEIGELRERLREVRGDAQRRQLQAELDRLELFCGYVLPDDTMVFLTNLAFGVDLTDIRKLTRERLVAAYAKARLYGGRPSDFVPGLFTPEDRCNVDDCATTLGAEEEKKARKKQE